MVSQLRVPRRGETEMQTGQHHQQYGGPQMKRYQPTKCRAAAALVYRPEVGVPEVVAAGRGHIADEIVRRAHEAGVEVVSEAWVAEVLAQMMPGERIPPQLYEVVARILAYVYLLDEKGR